MCHVDIIHDAILRIALKIIKFSFTNVGKQYVSIEEMFEDLQNYAVDAVFVDVFALVGYKEKLKERYLKVAAIIDTKTAYGFVLSGPSQYLKPDVKSMIFSRQKFMEEYVRSIKDDIPVWV